MRSAELLDSALRTPHSELRIQNMSQFRRPEELLTCSFCGKSQNDVRKLIAGPGVYVCNECIDICNEIINDDERTDTVAARTNLPKPAEIKGFLDEYVIGQDESKKRLSVAVYQHYKRLELAKRRSDIELQKSNILLIGPTGTGKTLLAQTLARHLSVPFCIVDATSLTEAGYVGEDVENILLRLLQAAGGDIEKAQQGIIYIDEIDKICRKDDNPSITRDVSGEGVQQALLKILEGTVANIPTAGGGRKHPQQDFQQLDTTNILFICGGAFIGLEKVIEKRFRNKSLGFQADVKTNKQRHNESINKLEPEDLIHYGLIPEFVGRLPVIGTLTELDEAALVTILTEPKNALVKQYQKKFEFDNIGLKFTEGALHAIAHEAYKRKIGARGLMMILEEILLESMYVLPSEKKVREIVVTREMIERKVPVFEVMTRTEEAA